MHLLSQWFIHFTGMNSANGHAYLFWSGFGADLPLFGGLITCYNHLNCHAPKCPRIGRRHSDGVRYCLRHHHQIHGK